MTKSHKKFDIDIIASTKCIFFKFRFGELQPGSPLTICMHPWLALFNTFAPFLNKYITNVSPGGE
jgi:hypothetical protein